MAIPAYRDRAHAGAVLADHLVHWKSSDDLVVLGLARGGVPVAAEVARALGGHLDVLVVRKLGAPGQEELAMGAVGPGGVVVRNHDVIRSLAIDEAAVERTIHAECLEIARREAAYRGTRPPHSVHGRDVLLVDDGLATGATMRAGIVAVRASGARHVVAAAPVGAPSTCREVERLADDVVCPARPADLRAVGHWYEDFSPTGDEEVVAALRRR
jgi:predicted phosphoribosyltransferase